jgi:hypothetical protein
VDYFYFSYESEPRGATRTQLGGDATISGYVNKESTTLHYFDRASHLCKLPLQFITLHDASYKKTNALPQGDRSPHHCVACFATACMMSRSERAIVSTRCHIVLAARPITCDEGAARTIGSSDDPFTLLACLNWRSPSFNSMTDALCTSSLPLF